MNFKIFFMVITTIAHIALIILSISVAPMSQHKFEKIVHLVNSVSWSAYFVMDIIRLASM